MEDLYNVNSKFIILKVESYENHQRDQRLSAAIKCSPTFGRVNQIFMFVEGNLKDVIFRLCP